MTGADYRESLRRLAPDGLRGRPPGGMRRRRPGLRARRQCGRATYDYALKPEYEPLMTAIQHTSGKRVNRLSIST